MTREQATQIKVLVTLTRLQYRDILHPFKKQLDYRFEYAEFVVWRYEQTEPVIRKEEIYEELNNLFELTDKTKEPLIKSIDPYINEVGELYDTEED